MYKGSGKRMALDCSTAALEARRQWSSVLKILTDHNFQPRSLYSVELSIKGEGAIETSSDKGELKILCPRPPFSGSTGECAPAKCRHKLRKKAKESRKQEINTEDRRRESQSDGEGSRSMGNLVQAWRATSLDCSENDVSKEKKKNLMDYLMCQNTLRREMHYSQSLGRIDHIHEKN